MSGTKIKGKRAANNALWENYKHIIESLYLKDGMSLKSTMEFMTNNHGFNMKFVVCLKAQYETMFKKWNFRKNIAAKQWSFINRCIENRTVLDKCSAVTIGNFHVNQKRIDRARARYNDQTPQEMVLYDASVPIQDLDSRPDAQNYDITVRTPPPPDLDYRHKLPTNLPWLYFLSKYNNTPMHLSASILNAGREIIRSSSFWDGCNEIPISAIRRTIQQEIFGRLRPLLLTRPDGYPTINLEQAFGLTTRSPHLEFLKLAAYILSNNIQSSEEENIGMKMIELCHSRGMLRFLESLLVDKQCTIRVMAEKLLVCAVRANDKKITRILLNAGASPKSKFNTHEDVLALAIELKRTELLPFLICAGGRGGNHVTQLALQGLEDISLKFLLKLSLETSQPSCAKKLLEAYHPSPPLDRPTLLHHALKECDVDIIELVLNYEAGRLWQNSSRSSLTCLEVACSTGNIRKVRLLLQNMGKIKGSGCGGFRKCLPYAVQSGNRQLVENLLIHGVQINDTSSSSMSCLLLVDMNDLPMVRYLLDCGADPNYTAMGTSTPLHRASRYGNVGAVRLLFARGAKLGPISGSQCSQDRLMEAAIQSRTVAVVEEILKAGVAADSWIHDKYATPLQLACYQGSTEIVRLLLFSNADINSPPIPCEDGLTALTAALRTRDIELVSYLLDHGADVNNPPAQHRARSPLQTCLEVLKYEMMVQLLERGADPEDSGALWVATCKEDLESVDLLLNLNRDVFSQRDLSQGAGATDFGRAALCQAVLSNKSQLVCTFLEAGIDFNRIPMRQFHMGEDITTRSPGRSAILAAIEATNVNLLQKFLGQGQYCSIKSVLKSCGNLDLVSAMHFVDFQDEDALEILKLLNGTVAMVNSYYFKFGIDKCVLQRAIECGCCSSIVTYLLSVGADINSPAGIRNGRTALQAAVENDRYDIVEMLVINGAFVNALPSPCQGATAFQFAAMNGNFKIAQFLLKADADFLAPRCKDYGRTAIEGAAENGHLDMVLYLLHLAKDVEGIDFEHQLCRATRLAWKEGHIALSETIQECQKSRYKRLHCERDEKHVTAFEVNGDNGFYEDDSDDQDSSNSDTDLAEELATEVSTRVANSKLPIRGLNVDEMPELEELEDSSMSCDSPDIYNFPVNSNCLRSSGEEDTQHEVTGGYEVATDGNANLPEFIGTPTQERDNNQMVDPNPFPDEYSDNFLDIPGSMATPQWDGFEIPEKSQTATENDPNLPECMATPTREWEDQPLIIPNLFLNDYSTDFLDIPGSMATPKWDGLDDFYDADMEEQTGRGRLPLG
ncbi:Ankyrin repeat-containing protein [Rutstroemia sp. NJR-2017a WRK4]|nr:Ankyrin repeat-containing protein [Rutstroemia sp. NJR-2017a WRK4]